jgi:hypothetical protein
MATLIPASSINDLRTRAHIQLIERLGAIDLAPMLVYEINSVAASALPYLAWQFDILSPWWQLLEDTTSQRSLILQAVPLHRIKGTPAAISQIVLALGFAGPAILEGQNVWGGTGFPSDEGWALFRVNVPKQAPQQPGPPVTDTISNSGLWSPSAGTLQAGMVLAVAGWGGGHGGRLAQGGAGGSYAAGTYVVTAGDAAVGYIAVRIGAGSLSLGSDGGDTNFGTSAVVAPGGGSVTAAVGTVINAGGAGASGGGGGSAGPHGAGLAASVSAGGAGDAGSGGSGGSGNVIAPGASNPSGGGGGRFSLDAGVPGGAGGTPGGGGGNNALFAGLGGPGAPGQITVTYMPVIVTGVAVTAAQQAQLLSAIDFFKPQRCVLDALQFIEPTIDDSVFVSDSVEVQYGNNIAEHSIPVTDQVTVTAWNVADTLAPLVYADGHYYAAGWIANGLPQSSAVDSGKIINGVPTP